MSNYKSFFNKSVKKTETREIRIMAHALISKYQPFLKNNSKIKIISNELTYLVKVTKNSYKILVYAGKRLIAVLVLTAVLFFSEQLFGSV